VHEGSCMAAYDDDRSVYVEDKAGDLGAPGSHPAWLSPDVDIPAHSGEAWAGSNQVQIRVHSHEEPILDAKITAEVYVGQPSLVMSPTTGTRRIDPGNLLFRPPNIAGSEPVANEPGGTLTFPWTPSTSSADVDGPGHRCLIVRAFPVGVTPPSSPFDVPNERHEAQHNIEVLKTQMDMASMDAGGAGTEKDPRRRDEKTGLWWERLATMAVRKKGRRFVVWAFDPRPSKELVELVRPALKKAKVDGFSDRPPDKVTLEGIGVGGQELDPARLFKKSKFAERAGLGLGLFAKDRLLAAAELKDLGPRRLSYLLLRFDHSNIGDRTAVVLHGAQWSERGDAEGGMTIVAVAPT
jgi:hypothetical protein